MSLNLSYQQSLKTRVTLLSLLIFLISILALMYFSSRILREDMELQLSQQQFSTVTILAKEVNQEIEERKRSLKSIASEITPLLMSNKVSLQDTLVNRPIFRQHFNGGVFVTQQDGTAIASLPISANRVGQNYLYRDHVANALQKGITSVSEVTVGKMLRSPVFAIATPVLDSQGEVIGALVGVIDLAQPNFLDQITESHYGLTGEYLLVSPKQRMVITGTGKTRIMQLLPAPNINPAIDRHINGTEGSEILVNVHGVEVLNSFKSIPEAGWYLVASLPTTEAFAPIYNMQHRMLIVAFLLATLSCALVWWMLRRQLLPVTATAKALADLSNSRQSYQPIPISYKDEIGELIGGFNFLLENLEHQKAVLQDNEERFRAYVEQAADALFVHDFTGRFVDVNQQACASLGYSKDELLGMNVLDVETDFDLPKAQAVWSQLNPSQPSTLLGHHRRKDGSTFPVEVRFGCFNQGSMRLFMGLARDITERNLAIKNLEASELRFRKAVEEAPFPIMIHAEDGNVLNLSRAWIEITGYTLQDIPTISDWTGKAYGTSWEDVRSYINTIYDFTQRKAEGEYEIRCKDGNTKTWEFSSIGLGRMHDGRRAAISIAMDVTERKRAEDSLLITASVFDNAQEAVLITDADNNIIDANPAFTQITGYSREEVIGKNPKLLSSGRQDKAFYAAMWQSLNQNKVWRGEIWNRRKSGEVFPEMLSISLLCDSTGKTLRHVAVFSDISNFKLHEAELSRIAHFDSLTGIANRVLLADRMKQSIAQTSREQNMMAICYLDLDGFKPVNDTMGHEAGDQILIEVSRRIANTIRGGDTVARLGGDEFVVLLLGLEKGEECVSTLERLLAAIAQPITVKHNSRTISASIGVSIYPLDNEDPDTLLRHADQAMYFAKQSGKNRFHIYDPALDRLAREQLEHLRNVRHALEHDQFELHYQPKVNLRTKQLVGAEALIRWRHPERGLLTPAEFLPHIGNTDLDIGIGEWVTAAALAQLSHWRNTGLDIEVSINISGYHMESQGFVGKLQQQLAQYPELPFGKLQIEVLETVALNDIAIVREIIESCQKIGVGFALDDFGTGYSSLTYLSSLPVDTLKIDQSFVRDMLEDKGDMAIVQGIIALARAFDRQTVAEGIETKDHYQVLLDMGCEVGQGYGIARPMPADKLLSWYTTFC